MTRATNPERRRLDAHVGARIKVRRKELGQTQWALADRLGISWQQLQKYERGLNRISVSLLHDVAKAQGVEIGHYVAGFADAELLNYAAA
jgi:transcriptional regulator with XRE-family HTH domain